MQFEEIIPCPQRLLWLPLAQLDGENFTSRDAYGHSCSVTGAAWRSGGRYFDGVDDLIDCGNGPALQSPTTGLTVTAWVKLGGSASGEDAILGKLNDNGVNRRSWMLLREGSGYIKFYCSSDGTHTNSDQITGGSVILADRYYHVALSYSPAAWFLTLDGAIDVSGVPGVNSLYQNTVDSLMVGNVAAGNRPFPGLIDEVAVYGINLSLAEIQRNYLDTRWRYQ